MFQIVKNCVTFIYFFYKLPLSRKISQKSKKKILSRISTDPHRSSDSNREFF